MAPMKLLLRLGRKPHPIDTQRYGEPRFAIYWAGPWALGRFTYPGLYVWTGRRQVRVLPVPRFPRTPSEWL